MKKKVQKIINGVKTEVEIEVDDEGVEVVPPESTPGNGGDDKETNIANLRKQLKEKDDLIASLQKGEDDDGDDLALDVATEPKAPASKEPSDTLKVIFQRDVREATLQWSSKNQVTKEQWQAIRKNVHLTGDETLSQIYSKIDAAYKNLPEVREAREKDLIEQGKKEAMKQTFDQDLDIPVGGDGGSGGAAATVKRVPRETAAWGKRLGLSTKELSEIDPEEDVSEYKILDPAYQDQ